MPEIAGVTSPIKVSGYFALTEAAAWFRLPGRGLLAVSGEDRVRFLNAMLTGDVRKLTAGEGCYAFSLDARGRVVADAGVYVLADKILLDTEPEGTAALRDHLEHHLIADDAEWRGRLNSSGHRDENLSISNRWVVASDATCHRQTTFDMPRGDRVTMSHGV